MFYAFYVSRFSKNLQGLFFYLLICSIPIGLALITIQGVTDVSIIHRVYIWTSVLNSMDLVKIILGGGAGYINYIMSSLGYPGTSAESFWFRLLFEHGVLGTIMYLWIMKRFYSGLTIYRALQPNKIDNPALRAEASALHRLLSAIVVYFLIFGIFIDINVSTKFAVFAYFAMGIVCGQIFRIGKHVRGSNE